MVELEGAIGKGDFFTVVDSGQYASFRSFVG